ncbi:hypothetical protein [Caballeronia sp. LZ034LL]|uniref:hypothetical protein n=1 Tax=Caballeronia sp. LZ034LL TaxID=3038567 RepID=UPI00285C7E1E|nr:hypothetical protein [Caballeronia sp. LZ034LL]MDR5838481.1 hypothetical protein [Caballeronia sp. LZ034LL]
MKRGTNDAISDRFLLPDLSYYLIPQQDGSLLQDKSYAGQVKNSSLWPDNFIKPLSISYAA